jgi:hypothetical protein
MNLIHHVHCTGVACSGFKQGRVLAYYGRTTHMWIRGQCRHLRPGHKVGIVPAMTLNLYRLPNAARSDTGPYRRYLQLRIHYVHRHYCTCSDCFCYRLDGVGDINHRVPSRSMARTCAYRCLAALLPNSGQYLLHRWCAYADSYVCRGVCLCRVVRNERIQQLSHRPLWDLFVSLRKDTDEGPAIVGSVVCQRAS